jgi:hypothetical protein
VFVRRLLDREALHAPAVDDLEVHRERRQLLAELPQPLPSGVEHLEPVEHQQLLAPVHREAQLAPDEELVPPPTQHVQPALGVHHHGAVLGAHLVVVGGHRAALALDEVDGRGRQQLRREEPELLNGLSAHAAAPRRQGEESARASSPVG